MPVRLPSTPPDSSALQNTITQRFTTSLWTLYFYRHNNSACFKLCTGTICGRSRAVATETLFRTIFGGTTTPPLKLKTFKSTFDCSPCVVHRIHYYQTVLRFLPIDMTCPKLWTNLIHNFGYRTSMCIGQG